MRRDTWFRSAALALVVLGGLGISRAQDIQVAQQAPPDTTKGVARIALINGEVNVRRGDSGDWVAAVVNAPLLVEDRIATGVGSRAEIQFDHANFLRLGANAEAQLAQLEANRYQIQIARGTVNFSVLRPTSADIEIDTPSVSVRPRERGGYRITVLDNGESEITVRSGQTEIYTPRGVETVAAGQTMLVRGDPANPEFQLASALAQDDWDRWNEDRDRRLDTAGNSVYNRYVSPDIYGAESTDGYGRWTYAPDYGGYVWSPAQAAGWAPYQNGRWVWEDYYGWTWVSYDPWGWAPYHYGRWFFNIGYGGWCWWPGPIRAHYWWAPAYVGFFGFGPGFGVGFAFGNVGWVPLAPFEVFHPWWGRGFYGGGFYGRTTIVNNINVYNTYRNARVVNGVTAVNSRDFGAGRFGNRVPVTPNALHSAGMVQGHLGITPSAHSLHFSDRAVTNAPRESANQRFFSHNQAVTGQRTPFGQQPRVTGGNGTNPTITGGRGNGLMQSPANNTGNWRRFNDPSAGSSIPQRSAPNNSGNSGGWHRFGEPGGAASPGAGNRGNAYSNGGSWQRFGSPNSGSAPRSNYTAPGAGGRIPVAPPSVHERGTPQYSAPQYSRPSGGYSTPQRVPQYSAPRAPQYSAPQYHSPSPSYSGGGRSYGGGGGHSSGGGGGGGGGSGGHSSSSHGSRR